MVQAKNIEGKPSEIYGMPYDEAKERGFLDPDPAKAEIMKMTYDEAKESGLLSMVELGNNDDAVERKRPSWMTAIGI